MSSVRRFVLDYIEYVSDLAVTNANLSSQELWNMVHASQKYSQLNVLFEKVFFHHPPLLLWNVCSAAVECLRGVTTQMTAKLVSELVYCKTRQEKNLL